MTTDRPSRANGFGGVLPAGRLGDLVAAAAGGGDPVAAWRRYRAALGAATADGGELRLYPFVGRRLDAATLATADFAPIRAQRRIAHVRHELLFAAAGEVADLFAGTDIRPVFLKGLALQIGTFGDAVIRASSDIDLFVAPDMLAPCLALVEQAGWIRKEERPRTNDPALIAVMRVKMTYRMPCGVQVDIHWVPREPLEFDRAMSSAFVEAVVVRPYRGRDWLIPSDLWLLFETIEHGVTWNEVTPIRWLVDAMAIIGKPDACIDWTALCDLAERTRLTRIFDIGLGELRRHDAAVPLEAIERLARARPSLLERLYTRSKLARPSPLNTIGVSTAHFFLRSPMPRRRRVIGFPAFYRMRALRCMSWSEVGGRALERLRPEPRR